MSSVAAPARREHGGVRDLSGSWWPLAGLIALAAVLRLSTLDLQSFWYDEAFTPVHVLHPSLSATLEGVVHTENSPPLWYVIAWLDARLFGTGEVALRLPSAIAGIATVPVAWAIGRELAGRRAAIMCAALVAVGPLFVWYSQEARTYALFVLTASLAMLCWLRARREPNARNLALFALSAALALLSHYFAVFLLIPMCLLLLFGGRASRRAAAAAVGAVALVGLALIPLILAQGGHGTQWIGRWPLSERIVAIAQYYLLGASGEPLGHAILLLMALPILAGVGLWLWRASAPPPRGSGAQAQAGAPVREQDRREREGVRIALLLAACGVLIPLLLALAGADYLAPRNLVAAMIPVTALVAVTVSSERLGTAGVAIGLVIALAFLAITVDVDLSPRLQRGNWRELASDLRSGSPERVITTVELGSAPLEYYMPGLHGVPEGHNVLVREIIETGYSPLRASAGEPPAPGFAAAGRLDVDGLIAFRFRSVLAREVSEATLRRHVITLASSEVLAAPAAAVGG